MSLFGYPPWAPNRGYDEVYGMMLHAPRLLMRKAYYEYMAAAAAASTSPLNMEWFEAATATLAEAASLAKRTNAERMTAELRIRRGLSR